MAVRKSHSKDTAVIGLDLGGTKLASALFLEERPVSERSVPLDGRAGGEVGRLIGREVKRLLGVAARRNVSVRAIGIAVPGIANQRTGRVWAPNIPGWDDYPLKSEIRSVVSESTAKVIVESDRATAILGEVWQGAGRGCRDAIFLAVGTGIGAGILVNGCVLRGAHDIAGAIGWLALDRPFQPEYTDCGCFESHASGEGIAKVAARILAKRKAYRGPLRNRANVTAHDVFAAYEDNDAVAKEVLQEAIQFWGMATANLVSLFNPEKIVFGGGVFGPAKRFLEDIATEARRWAQPVAMQRVSLEASQLGGDAILYGAAFRAIQSM